MDYFHKKILDNNKKWVEASLKTDPNYFQDLAKGQTPPLLFIGFTIVGFPPGFVTDL